MSGAEPRHKIHWEELRYEMNPYPGDKFWLDTRRTTTEVRLPQGEHGTPSHHPVVV